MKKIIEITALILLVACTTKKSEGEIALPYYSDATFTAEWIGEDDPKMAELHRVPDFEFINQDGESISNSTFDNGIYVTNFFFTACPTVCPKMEANLSLVQDKFLNEGRVKILSHTVMPWADSVARLKEYAQLNEITSEKWHLVTGEQEELYKMGRLGYFVDEGFGKGLTDLDDFLHTENIVLIDSHRRIRGIYNGTLKLEIKRMIDDMRLLLKE